MSESARAAVSGRASSVSHDSVKCHGSRDEKKRRRKEKKRMIVSVPDLVERKEKK